MGKIEVIDIEAEKRKLLMNQISFLTNFSIRLINIIRST